MYTTAYSASAPRTVTPASLGQRVGARLIDGVIILPMYFVFGFLLIAPILGSLMAAERQGADSASIESLGSGLMIGSVLYQVLGLLVISCAYDIVFLRWKGATVGKLALGLKVVPADDLDTQLSWGAILKRVILPSLPYLISQFLNFIVTLVLMFSIHQNVSSGGRGQGFHDQVAGTLVVKFIR